MQTKGTQINRQTNGIAVIVLVNGNPGSKASLYPIMCLSNSNISSSYTRHRKLKAKQYKFQSLSAGCHQSQHIGASGILSKM
jgi:hypothetical protein